VLPGKRNNYDVPRVILSLKWQFRAGFRKTLSGSEKNASESNQNGNKRAIGNTIESFVRHENLGPRFAKSFTRSHYQEKLLQFGNNSTAGYQFEAGVA